MEGQPFVASGVMRHIIFCLGLAGLVAFAVYGPAAPTGLLAAEVIGQTSAGASLPAPAELSARAHTEARYQADLVAVRRARPSYPFWQHIFTIPDGRIIFGSAETGRLLASFPTRGNWAREGIWEDPALAAIA